MYTCMTLKENSIYKTTAEISAKKLCMDRKRKATDLAKENRRRSKYTKVDNSISARKAYSSLRSLCTLAGEKQNSISRQVEFVGVVCH